MTQPILHVWKEQKFDKHVYQTCVCGALRRDKRDDAKPCPRVDRRRALRECEDCYYPRICGQGFTEYICAICGVEQSYANTCIPKLCNSCADKHALCVRCAKPREKP